jgi:hypothetical protein
MKPFLQSPETNLPALVRGYFGFSLGGASGSSWILAIRLLALSWLSCAVASNALGEDQPPIRFDHVIERINRLEFYRLADFGPPGSDCHPCRIAQHVGCMDKCYAEITSLSLICTPTLKGMSVGPFTREERGQLLGELFKTDTVLITTALGDEPLAVRHITSASGESGDDYAIDLEGIEGFKNTLIRASSLDSEQFSIIVGNESFVIPLSPKIRDGFQRLLKQCPD